MTKAQLIEKLETATLRADQAEARAQVAAQDCRDAEDALDDLEHRHGFLHIWPCPNSPSEPICIVGPNDEGGLGMNVYMHEGDILGVAIYDRSDPLCPFLAQVGLVAVED